MVAEQLAQPAELGLSGVLQAELKGLVSRRLVHDFESGVVLEDVENGTVCLPEELEPWCDDDSVGPVARLFARDSGEENRLWGFGSFEITDVCEVTGALRGRGDFISLGLGFRDLLFGKFDKAAEDELCGLSEVMSQTSCWTALMPTSIVATFVFCEVFL